MVENKMKILIVGQGAASSALAKKLSKYDAVEKIYVAPSIILDSEKIENIDIRETNTTELLKFVLENDVDLTVPVSENALKADIVSFFLSNGQNIFGPIKGAYDIAVNKVFGKKFLYKIHAQTSKFGVFDKIQTAEDWLKGVNFPVTIKCSEYTGKDDRLVCPTITLAREFIDNLFSKGESTVLIEEYTYGHNYTVYYITDGYSAIPISSVANYKFAQDGDGGFFTNGVGCYANDYKISEVILSRMDNIVKNTLNSLEKKGTPYIGILGVDCTITDEDKFYVNEFKSFLQDYDAAAILNLVEDDLIKIFMACIDGLFADEYEEIKTNNLSSVSAVVTSRQASQTINGLDFIEDINNIDFSPIIKKTNENKYITSIGEAFVITRSASTLNRARQYLYDDLNAINFAGMKYRKDICN
jgi:phosphoribosylamine--glycine ligase